MSDPYHYNDSTHEIFAKRAKEYVPLPGGMGKFIFDSLKKLSLDETLIAQIDGGTGRKQNFKELFESAMKLAQYMRKNGIQPGDNITMCSFNHLNAALDIIAAQFIGAVPSCTDPLLSLEDTKHLLNLIKPKIIFVSEGSEDLIKSSLEYLKFSAKITSVTLDEHEEYETIEGILKVISVDNSFEPVYIENLSETCAILFSSGTTGMPKGICLSHNYFLAQLLTFPAIISKEVKLNYASFYWISALYGLMSSVYFGSTLLLCKKFDRETHWDTVRKYKVTLMILSNTFAMEASKYLSKEKAGHLGHLKSLVIGGGLIPDKYLSFYEQMLPNTCVGMVYAFTEGGYVSQCMEGDRFASSGKLAGIDQTIKIVDPDTEENLPLNKVGEIRIKRAYQMNGYYKMDSKDAWDDQGFLKTGDLGYIDEEFNLVNVDRIKEMFKYRSWHVVPAKIENLLLTHPDVLYAVVIGKPTNDEDENHAMALVCLKSSSTATANEFEDFVNKQMDEINKIRAGVVIIQQHELKLTPTGKINRRLMKSIYIQ